MSVATEIARIQTDRNKIRTKLVAMGLATGTASLDDCANAVEGITDCGSVSATVTEGSTYTIPRGYHSGSGTVSGVKGGGNYSLQSKTVTPTKSQANVTPDSGYYGLSDVTVNPIPDNFQDVTAVTAAAGDVLANKVIVDSTGKITAGTMPNNGGVYKQLGSGNDTYTIPAGYHDGTGTVGIKWMTSGAIPSKETVTLSAPSRYAFSSVVVEPIPDEYQDVTGVTATAGGVLAGSKFVAADGTVVTGTMPDKGAVTKTLDTGTKSYTVPAGYHNGEGTVQIVTEEKTVTPAPYDTQIITPSSGKVLGQVVVNPIPSEFADVSEATATADEVLSGRSFVGSNGVLEYGTIQDKGEVHATLTPKSSGLDISHSYFAVGSSAVVANMNYGTVTPTKSEQVVSASDAFFSKFTVAAIPAKYQDVSSVTATAANVLSGSKFVNSSGTVVTGTMTNRGKVTATIDGLTTTSYTIAAGYHNGSGTVSLTSDIETALAAI